VDAIDEASFSPAQRARREVYRSVALRHLGRPSESVEACRRARDIAREPLDDPDPLFAELDLEEGIALGVSGQFDPARQRFERAANGFAKLHDDHRCAESHDGLGLTLWHLGRLTDSLRAYPSAQQLWRALGDLRPQITTMIGIADVQYMLGDLATAHDSFNAVIQGSRDLRFARGEAYGQLNLAAVEHDLGHLESAASLYTMALQAAQTFDDAILVADATHGLAMVYREQGEPARARALLEHGLRTVEHAGMLFYEAAFRGGLRTVLLGEERTAEARPLLEEAVATAERSASPQVPSRARLRVAALHLRERQRARASESLTETARSDRVDRLRPVPAH